ncbi:hypothetical protein [Alkalihalobacterium alkalinitrilicum]|uniref:hypothetical protein n=1 Tax=Alkalihalobacterium alkalinitrilicum TaxID=427920 RepID=UPI0009949A4F|nr:hypothetical protein [Alkalihalobacterium alkalinitrilicum]
MILIIFILKKHLKDYLLNDILLLVAADEWLAKKTFNKVLDDDLIVCYYDKAAVEQQLKFFGN